MKVEHERHRALRERLLREKLLTSDIAAQLEDPWRSNGVLVQAVFFILTCIAVAAFFFLMETFKVPREGIVTGIVAIALAEYLIRVRRWFGTGVEPALWLAGLIALISELPSSGEPEAILVLGSAYALAGARVRNPILGVIAVGHVAQYFEERFDLGVAAAVAIGVAAMCALLREWRRPSNEWLFALVPVGLPIYGWTLADPIWRAVTIILYLMVAVIGSWFALRRPHHAFFLTAIAAGAIASTEIGRLLAHISLEARLAAGGAFLLALAALVSRLLRDRTRGFVLTPVRLTPFDDELELAATLTMAPEAPREEPQRSGGGSFGGGGATGDF